MSFTELSQVHNVHISNDYNLNKRRRRRRTSITAGEESEANVTCGFTAIEQNVLALDFVACQSKKRANIGNICKTCLCSPSSIIFAVEKKEGKNLSFRKPLLILQREDNGI